MSLKSKINWSESTLKVLVSNKNIIPYFYYLKIEGYEASKLLFKDQFEEDFFLNKDEWCTLEDYVRIVEKACEITNNFELPKIVGALLQKYLTEYRLREFKDAIFNNIKTVFYGPLEIFRQISFFNHLFNQTKDMEFIKGSSCQCLWKIKFKAGINPVFDYVSENHIAGMIASVIDLFGLKNALIEHRLKEYDLKTLIEVKFKGIREECYTAGNLFYLGKNIIAEKVSLISERTKQGEIFLGKNKLYVSGDQNWAWKITRDVYLNKKYLVLKKDEIYNAPYFICYISWEKVKIYKGLFYLLRSRNTQFSPLNFEYKKLIQNRSQQEQEKIKILEEKQKIENEFHQLLLKTYIHPYFIHRARKGLIKVKQISVTNIFLDLVQSTQMRIKLGDEIFRRDKNIFLNLIKKNIAKADPEWGWLNKVMGDGCYIVFGAYNYFNKKQDYKHLESALVFSQKLLADIAENKKKGLMTEMNLRIGIETGEVEIGEAYEREIENQEQEINLGTLRIFDTDGQSVHVAKRIEETIKMVLAKRNNPSQKNGVFVGPVALKLLKNNKKFKVRPIDLNKYEAKVRDIDSIKIVGEVILGY